MKKKKLKKIYNEKKELVSFSIKMMIYSYLEKKKDPLYSSSLLRLQEEYILEVLKLLGVLPRQNDNNFFLSILFGLYDRNILDSFSENTINFMAYVNQELSRIMRQEVLKSLEMQQQKITDLRRIRVMDTSDGRNDNDEEDICS